MAITSGASPGIVVTSAIADETAVNQMVVGKAASDDNGFTDETTEANDASVDDMLLLPASPVVDEDGYLFGMDRQFGAVRITIGQQGVGTWTITWRYYNGTSYVPLTGVVDGTAGFTAAAGTYDVTFDRPDDWEEDTVDTHTGFHIEARLTAFTSITTQPLGTQAWISTYNQMVWSDDLVTIENGQIDTDSTPPLKNTFANRLVMARRGDADEETKYVISVSAGAGTTVIALLSEDMAAPVLTGDQLHCSYVLEDVEEVSGCTFVTKGKIFDFGREITIGNGTDFAWVALLDAWGVLENDAGASDASWECSNNGLLQMGYQVGGVSISGCFLQDDTARGLGELSLQILAGGMVRLYDAIWRSTETSITITFAAGSTSEGIFSKGKMFKVIEAMGLDNNILMEDWVIEGTGTATELITCGENTNIQSLILINTNGLTSPDDAATETIEIRNVNFILNTRMILVHDDKTWKVVNPTWDIDPTTQDQISFAVDDLNSVEVLYSDRHPIQELDGTPIVGAVVLVYEGLLNQNIPHQGVTDVNGEAPMDIIHLIYTDNAGTALTVEQRGDFSIKVYKYTFVPALIIEAAHDAPATSPATLLPDPAITEATQATAITAGSSVVEKHGAGEDDPRAINVINYDTGVGTVPNVGETITGAGGATGVLVEYIGDETSGTLVLETRNATAFVDNEQLTGGASSFDADAHLTGGGSFDENYTWLIDANGDSMTVVYDYIMAKLAEDPIDPDTGDRFLDTIIWGEGEWAQPLFSGGSGWFTVRNVNFTEGWWIANRGSGAIAYFTSDDGAQFIPPATFTHTLTGLQLNTEVTYVLVSDGSEVFHVEDATAADGGGFYKTEFTYIYSGDIVVNILIFHVNYDPIYLDDVTITNLNESIPNVQLFSRFYLNP